MHEKKKKKSHKLSKLYITVLVKVVVVFLVAVEAFVVVAVAVVVRGKIGWKVKLKGKHLEKDDMLWEQV